MASKFSYHCKGVTEEGWVCDKAHLCARCNPLSTRVSRLCYSGFSFFIPRITDEYSAAVATESVVD